MAESYSFEDMSLLPSALRPSALVLSAGDGPEGLPRAGTGVELDGAGWDLARVLRKTSSKEVKVAGAMEYWVLSEAESASTPKDSAIHETADHISITVAQYHRKTRWRPP